MVLLDALALVVAGHQLRHLVESVERVPVKEVFLGGPGRLHPRGKVDRVALGHLEQAAGTRKKLTYFSITAAQHHVRVLKCPTSTHNLENQLYYFPPHHISTK